MGASAGFSCTIQLAGLPSTSFTNEATTASTDLTTFTMSNILKRSLDKAVATVTQSAHDELQTVTITGSPTGGTFTLTFGANTTGAIAYNAAASVVQTALQGLASVGAGNALVSGSAGGPYTVQFTASLGLSNVAAMTATPSFTGGSSPGVAIAELQAGSTWATASGFTLYRCNARVVFAVAQAQGTQVRFSSGSYMPLVTLGNGTVIDFAGKIAMLDGTVFNTPGVYTYVPGLLTATLKLTGWWVNTARAANLQNRDLLFISFTLPSTNRYEAFCYVSDCGLKSDVKALVGEDLSFQLTDELAAA